MPLDTSSRAAAALSASPNRVADAQLEELAQVGKTKQGGAPVQDESSTMRTQGLSEHERSGRDEGVQVDHTAPEDQEPGVDNEKNDSDLDSLSSANDSSANGDNASASRRTVLYPEGEDKTFPSYTSFVAHCNSRLLRRYGWTAHTGHRYPDYVVARCCRYRPDSCKFAVRAEKQPDGRWKVNRDKCRWEHSHGPGDGEDESSPDDMSVEEEPEVSPPQPDHDVADEEDSTSDSDEHAGNEAFTKASGAASARPAGWNASTYSPVMLQLVDDRDTIFLQQRSFLNDARQDRCHKLMQDYFSTLSSANTVPRGSFAQYETFCANNNIPPFPITPSLVALALFAKCSAQNGHYYTFKGDLQRFGKSTESVWAEYPEYQRLAERGGVNSAIEDFLQERKGVRLRAFNAGEKRNRQSGSSSESAYSSHSETGKRSTRSLRKTPSVPPARAASTSAYSDSNSTEGDDSGGESDGDIDGQAAPSQMVIPNLPSPNDSFSSLTELYLAYATALIRATGISVQILHQSPTTATVKCNRFKSRKGSTPCPCLLSAQLDHETQRWQIDPAASTLRHAHGPAKEILRDPSWRPRIRNPGLRKALGLASIDKPTPRKKNEKASRNRSSSKPKKQVVTSAFSARPGLSTSSTRGFTPGTTALPPPPSAGYPFPPTFAPFGSSALPQQYQSPSHAYSSSSTFFQPPQPAYQSQPAYPAQQKPAYSLPLPASTFPSAHLSSSAPSAPLSPAHLAAFLTSLHPSLAPLAPNLAACGLSTLDSLVALTLLEPATLDAVVEHLRALSENEQTRPLGGVRVSLGKLLVKGLREAVAATSGSGSGSGSSHLPQPQKFEHSRTTAPGGTLIDIGPPEEEQREGAPRTTILFPLDESFGTSYHFLVACDSRLQRMYGTGTLTYVHLQTATIAHCARRAPDNCKFAVSVEYIDASWSVSWKNCHWSHSHGPGLPDPAAAAHPLLPHTRPTLDYWVKPAPDCIVHVRRLRAGTVYTSASTAPSGVALPRAVHPVAGGATATSATSIVEKVKRRREKSAVRPQRLKMPCPAPSPEVVHRPPPLVPPPLPFTLSNLPPLPPLPPRPATSPSLPLPAALASPLSPDQATPPSLSPPPPALSATVKPFYPRPPTETASWRPPTTFFTPDTLSAFLTSLHPSLAILAPAFFTAGLDSVEALAQLALLEPGMLEALLDESFGVCGGGEMSVVQRDLLAEGLRKAAATA